MASFSLSLTTLPLLLLLSTSTWNSAHSQTQLNNGKTHYAHARQYSLPPLYSAPSGAGGPGSESHFPDVQYDVGGALNSPQLQYPGVGGGVSYPQQGGYFPNTRSSAGQQPVLIYSGAGGQPFLVNPGGLPPGTNFLIPQPGPPGLPPGLDTGVIYRDAPPPPNGFNPGQRPVFVAGYPKPAHIPGGYQPPGGLPGGRPPPPIEKDAEEIPTGPGAAIPPHPQGTKPQKIETFDEPSLPNNKPSDKADEPAEPQPSPKKPTRQRPKLNPGQRFFILNGQPLFSNYPHLPYFGNGQYQGIGPAEFYKQQYQQFQQPSGGPHFPPGFGTFSKPSELDSYRNFLYKNGPVLDEYPGPGYKPQNIFFKNVVPFGILNRIRNGPLRSGGLPQHLAPVPAVATSSSTPSDQENSNPQSRDYEQQKHISKTSFNYENDDDIVEDPRPNIGVADRFDYFRYGTDRVGPHAVPTSAMKIAPEDDDDDDDDRDSVVIDAKVHQGHDSTDKEKDNESEDVDAAQDNNKVIEPSISQAQPGAIALAGPGGVAAAGPRGTALAGEGGLAVSSPTATAVAGPRNDDAPSVNKKPTKKSKQ